MFTAEQEREHWACEESNLLMTPDTISLHITM